MRKLSAFFAILLSVQAFGATTTPNMSLLAPQVGDTDYPTSITTSFTLMDSHDHSAGKGVQVGTSGLATGSVTAVKLGTNSVTDTKLSSDASIDGNRAVGTNHIKDGAVTTAKLPDGAVTLTKLAARPTGTTVSAGGVAVSTSCGTFSTTSTSAVDVTNLSVTITTTGRPVRIALQPDGSGLASVGTGGHSAPGNGQLGHIYIVRASTTIASNTIRSDTDPSSNNNFLDLSLPPGVISSLDLVAAGTYTYKIQADIAAGYGGSLTLLNSVLVIYEI